MPCGDGSCCLQSNPSPAWLRKPVFVLSHLPNLFLPIHQHLVPSPVPWVCLHSPALLFPSSWTVPCALWHPQYLIHPFQPTQTLPPGSSWGDTECFLSYIPVHFACVYILIFILGCLQLYCLYFRVCLKISIISFHMCLPQGRDGIILLPYFQDFYKYLLGTY